ncbi:MAG TPA: FlgD immunoglobulin-like domain containing protein [Candidatus Eisenbacteria bacterium]|jgi:hypothetical protein
MLFRHSDLRGHEVQRAVAALAACSLFLVTLAPSDCRAIETMRVASFAGTASGDQLGFAVAAAGDVNGDGIPDFMIGSPNDDAAGTNAGRVSVYFGGLAFGSTPSWALAGQASGEAFGWSVSRAGDINGDGFGDIVVGAPYSDVGGTDIGRAYVFFGGTAPDATPDLTLTGAVAGDLFGFAVSGGTDVTEDGYADVIIGAPRFDVPTMLTDAGRAYVYYGAPMPDGVADLTLSGQGAGDQFGFAVGFVENGVDRICIPMIGAPFNDAGGTDAGRVYLYLGGTAPDALADITITGTTGENLGWAVSGAGDVNSDGYGDALVGAPGAATTPGKAYLYYGGLGFDNVADLTLTGQAVGDRFGSAVAGDGDLNGDGICDLIVGAPQNDGSGTNAGRVYAFFGGSSIDAVADLFVGGTATGDSAGVSVASVGDFDRDGYGDIVAGSSGADPAGIGSGVARLFAVFPYRLLSPNGGETWVSGSPYIVTWLGHDPVDIAVSDDGGVTWQTVATGVGGGGGPLSVQPIPAGNTVQIECGSPPEPRRERKAKARVSQTGKTPTHATSDESDAVFRLACPATPPGAARLRRVAPNGSAANDNLGSALAVGDVNGDGHPDLVAGAPQTTSSSGAGKVLIYLGGQTGIDATPDITLVGESPLDGFGAALVSGGDVNGDRIQDLMIGAPFNDGGGPNAGRAYLYLGATTFDLTPDLVLSGVAGDNLGAALAMGDMNRDGFADMLVGAPLAEPSPSVPDAGRAYVYYGAMTPDGTADLTFTGDAAGDHFGDEVGVIQPEFLKAVGIIQPEYLPVVGAPLADPGGRADAGIVRIFDPRLGTEITLVGEAAGDQFGSALAGKGDMDGDAAQDLLVGAPLNDAGGADAGRAYAYSGAVLEKVLTVVGPPEVSEEVQGVTGGAPDLSLPLRLTGAAAGDHFGAAVAIVGDVNGDGTDDMCIGAPLNDAGGADAGRAYLYYGGPYDVVRGLDPNFLEQVGGLDPHFLPAHIVTGTAGDHLGVVAVGGGLQPEDDFNDIVIGADRSSAGGTFAGKVELHDMNRYHLLSPVGGETVNVGALMDIVWLGTEGADIELSVDGGSTFQAAFVCTDCGNPPASDTESARIVTFIPPHTPTKFARIRLRPSSIDAAGKPRVRPRGFDISDSNFTIQSSITLLSLSATSTPEGTLLTWASEPAVGPTGIAGYRLYRLTALDAGNGTRIGPALITATLYLDADAPGASYRLTAVNGLQEELELGRVTVVPKVPLAAWPLPHRGGALTISFATYGGLGGGAGEAVVELYDLSGRLVRTVARGMFPAGYQLATWDGRNDRGQPVGSGIYFLRARSARDDRRLKVAVIP